MILVDPPTWPGWGRTWSHLVSDTSLAELHDFAERVRLPRRLFDEDAPMLARRRQHEVRLTHECGRHLTRAVVGIVEAALAQMPGAPPPGVTVAKPVVKEIVELHGGWVDLESERERGTTVVVHLPEEAAETHAAPELDLKGRLKGEAKAV